MMKSTMITAVLVLLMLAVPGSIASIGAQDQGTVAPGTDDVLQGEIVDTTDDITMEAIDSDTVRKEIGIDPLTGLGSTNSNGVGLFDKSKTIDLDRANLKKFSSLNDKNLFIPPGMEMESPANTRASDKDNNDDLGNGSVLNPNPKEAVNGQLEISQVQAMADIVDWYKIQIPSGQVNPVGGSSGFTQNYTVKIKDFSSSEMTLEEMSYRIEGTTTVWLTDYIDTLEIWIYYIHYSWHGLVDMGGREIIYDDQDDTDGWTYDSNWSTGFRPVIDSQNTVEDTNGYTNTLTERGWYYIAVRYLYFTTAQGVPPRSTDYTVDYTLEVEKISNSEPNNYPFTTSNSNGAGNDWKNATTTAPTGRGSARVDSDYNNADWYKWKGLDNSKLYNMTFNVTINNYDGFGTHIGYFEDLWVTAMVISYTWGDDKKWGTSDDDWGGLYTIFSFQLDSRSGPFRNLFNGQNKFSYFVHINTTDLPSGVSPDNMDPRTVYLAIWVESINLGVDAQNNLFVAPSCTRWWADYQIDWQTNERIVNSKPVLTDLKVKTSNPPEVYIYSPIGGYYETEFRIEVTYTDVENYSPKGVWLIFDKGTAKERSPINMLNNPVDPSDLSYNDGVSYYFETTGEVLTTNPETHTISIYAIDSVNDRDVQKAITSNFIYDNSSLKVWDDNPVKLVKTWPGLPVLSEDSQAEYIPLEGIDGAFDDPEKSFRGFNIWNPDIKGWVYDYEVMNPDDTANVLVSVNISKDEGFWQAKLTLGPNEHYSEGVPLLFRGYDDHSEINRSSRLIINPVNDPPMVTSVKVGSVDYTADNTNPLLPIVHLDTQLTFKEDQLITFSIMAEDTDKENERSALEYSYEPNPSSPWEGNPLPQIDMTTGVVTYTPTNGDVNKPLPNNKMVFTIDDRGADGDIKLTVYLKVENVNDAPALTIPTGTRSFQQFTTLAIKPQASDEDRGDTLKFEVNFEEPIGDTPSVLDQLTYINPQKTLDWDLNENTGEFWFKLSDQNIWKTATGNQKTTSIVIAFKVTDKAGLSDTKTVTFDLQDVNEEPPAPKKVTSDPAEKQEVNKAVIFTVEEVVDPDGDKLYYKWNFGDGFTGEGVNVTHVYTLQGIKTVEVWVEDGQFQTDKYTYRIEILKKDVIVDDDDDDDDDDDTDKQSDFPIVLVIGGVFLILIILAFIIIALVVLRKKPAPAAQYPYDPALMAYNYQGLPPGAPGQLPPGQAPELPPAPEYAGTELPPAQPEQPPVAPMTAQTAQPAPEQMGGSCPSCNAPVDPSWFLCPNCKAPLQ